MADTGGGGGVDGSVVPRKPVGLGEGIQYGRARRGERRLDTSHAVAADGSSLTSPRSVRGERQQNTNSRFSCRLPQSHHFDFTTGIGYQAKSLRSELSA
jgi:hypothetical protein